MSSSRSPPTSRNRYDHGEDNNDDVERYRQQNRQTDRQHRQQEQEKEQVEHGRQRQSRRKNNNDSQQDNNDDGEVAVAVNNQKKIVSDREQRMARLRQELKNEDETLAALDQRQAQKGQAGGGAEQAQLQPQETIIEVNPEELEGLDEEEQMKKLLGFDGFGSTKGQSVEDNQSTAARGGAAKNKARKYRQYMNRKSGFNRPLEKMN